MTKPSEIFDTPEAISRVGGNEEVITEIVERVRFVEFLHGVPVELPSETKELLRSGIRKALTTKDQEKEETIKSIIASIDAEIIQRYKGFALDAGEVGFNDGLRRAKYIISRALPIEDNK